VYDQGTQDALCYAPGRRGALSAFHGIELPAQRKRIASMYLALGYVRADERFDRLYDAILLDRELENETQSPSFPGDVPSVSILAFSCILYAGGRPDRG
jgi:hypothetical protein